MEDLETLMQEPPGGLSYGRTRLSGWLSPAEGGDAPVAPLSAQEAQSAEFMREGGWTVAHTAQSTEETGMTAHRGVVHPDEHIDLERVRTLVEHNLGCPLAEIEEVYRAGRPTTHRARTRAAIDARFLALSRAGGNMTALARVLGWPVDETGSCWRMKQALARARQDEAVAA